MPAPAAGEVLVRVLTFVNNTDINTRVGWYAKEASAATNDVEAEIESGGWGGTLCFPRIQGGDLCGEVVSVGAGLAVLSAECVTCPHQSAYANG